MRQTSLYTKTRKTLPKDEVATNAKLLIKGGFVHKELAGVYSYLPLGVRVLTKIENIIREEMNRIGGQEILMSSLQDQAVWERNDRWSDKKIDIWFKDRTGKVGFAWSHEEPIMNMVRHHIGSYKDMPVYVYQFQNKFRNEPRAKSGLLRGREFIMKDLYSFNVDGEGLDKFYETMKKAYMRIFDRVGIGNITYLTFASGGLFTKFSHEFQTLSSAGEDVIYLDKKGKIAINKEVMSESVLKEIGVSKKDLVEEKAIEVGNIFKFGTKYSENMGVTFKDKSGKEHPVYVGSYGIGLGRLMATIVETLSDDSGIIWPDSVAPFQVHLIELEKGSGETLYKKLEDRGVEVLYDDRDATPGEKFKDSDLIGIPWRFVVSKKTGTKVECKRRNSGKAELLTYDKAIGKLL
ncbi:MAG: prolyl-tRNA synthetase [Candidatus Colwellbacteria bacterium RIFCSPHIGHO2_02_FULL_45_17]|uniref:Proline--tRNA ligase n=3 Tax=Parcubacteria group TaxID=1794811 RepID=A0A0H4T712_9BACT|nr:prolyl-tRNA synthetase [uncultured Parcubacteria bacterium Rifle_16ft_4_minimus_37647]OGY58623.1 MAG: prolyl-tRNA synthetase [Candidatus Colwellbacteria bacterium RIFCSPHIGHO2_02_FULL_45_17]OGY61718.1 MAG: prolyl-tRNA synthetase [Candidatus Colwellbacteria bacterium RIFCSPLOWO2_02_FULL_45_11]OGY62710.1 MAG: prolyl-tRNA synthetase [Candidatus Colwellbacteria bacterium RIFCSPLOWO2_12_FULL_46_17]